MSKDIYDPLSNEIDRETHVYKPSTIRSIKNTEVADKTRHYVDKKAFYEALVKRSEAVKKALENGQPKPRISDEIGKYIMTIVENMGRKYNFVGYTYRDEMVGDAIEHCLRHIDSFDITKSNNPFSYFTQATYFVFINRIKSEKKELYVKCKSTLDHAAYGDLSALTAESDDIAEHLHDNFMFNNDFVENYVKEYEEKLNSKKKESSQKVIPKKESLLDDLIED